MTIPFGIDGPLPRHIAIAMDGNGRWAQQRGKQRTHGHRIGVDVARETILFCHAIGLEVLTLYAFSMENWGRDPYEIEVILEELLPLALSDNCKEFNRLGIRLEVLGEVGRLSDHTQRVIHEVKKGHPKQRTIDCKYRRQLFRTPGNLESYSSDRARP